MDLAKKFYFTTFLLIIVSIILLIIFIFSIMAINNIYNSPIYTNQTSESVKMQNARKWLIISILINTFSLWIIFLFLFIMLLSAKSFIKLICYSQNKNKTSSLFYIILILIILVLINFLIVAIFSIISLVNLSKVNNKDDNTSKALEYNIIIMALSWFCVLFMIGIIIFYISFKYYKKVKTNKQNVVENDQN